MKLSGTEWKELRSALCEAFPTRREMGRLLNDHFGINIDEIAGYEGNLLDVADDIIRWFSARDQIVKLIQSSFAERPNVALIQKLAQQWGQIPVLPGSENLERILRQENRFLDPEIWFGRFRDVINQVCQIEVKLRSGESVFGSGVLIGPNIILTNYHVIEGVANPTSFQQDGHDAAPSDVIIRFDHKKGRPSYIQPGVEFCLESDWLVDSSPYYPSDSPSTQMDWQNFTASGLDYALLRVKDEPGAQNLTQDSAGSVQTQRGWINLDHCTKKCVAGMGMIVAQYPQGGAMKIAIETNAVIGLNSSKNRVKHKVNTDKGSSGAPCFTLDWDLVALHQAGIASMNSTSSYNIAIPISSIIANLKENGKAFSLGLLSQK